MMKQPAWWMIAMLVLFCGCAEKKSMVPVAGSDDLARFSVQVAGRDFPSAFLSLRRVQETFWQQTPLFLNNPRFVQAESNSFGLYEPREGEEFASGEVIYLYMEPVGFSVRPNPAGYNEFGFKADFTLKDAQGKWLAGQKDFASVPFKSWNFNTEVSLTFNYTFTGLEAGRYKVITEVRDIHSEKNATVEKWFSIR